MRKFPELDEMKIYTEHAHSAKVTVCRLSPSGYYGCSGDSHGHVHVWSTGTLKSKLKM